MRDMIVVWFSCGVASAVAAKKTMEKYGATHDIRVVNNPVMEEDEDNRRFLISVEKWLGITIEICTNPKYPTSSAEQVWIDRQYMSGIKGAPRTAELKKQARYIWEAANNPNWHVLGFCFEEKARFDRFKKMERENVLPILIELGLTKEDCHSIILAAGIDPPRVYELGYPNANCIGCVKATSPTYWNLVREKHPSVFKRRALLSSLLGVKLVRYNGKRIKLDDLPADAKGRPLKSMKAIECGIFCDTK